MTASPSQDPQNGLARYLPILVWGRTYNGEALTNDLLAAVIVTIMLIPQSLAYAMLAGLPPQMGLYASILPLVAYALFGTSRALAVGPVAVISLMTAAAASRIADPGTPDYIAAALVLATLSGVMLTAMGLFRLGFIVNFLSHPVVSGFITASSLLIAASQLRHILGVEAGGYTLWQILGALSTRISEANLPTLLIGVSATLFFLWVRKGFRPVLLALGLGPRTASLVSRTGPLLAVAAGIALVASLGLQDRGVAIVGTIPTGLPPITLPPLDPGLWTALFGSAALIALIGFVESVSVAQTLAAKKRQRIDADQELLGLGAANVAAGLSGGYPVTGGFARSAVNFDAGAQTPAAGAFTAIGIALAALFLTPYLFFLPRAVLAATIIVAVLSLIDFTVIRRVWSYSKRDFLAMAATILVTLGIGVEIGVVSGVLLSIGFHLYRTSRPHFALVGQVPGSQHFRDAAHHDVVTSDRVLTVRIDESLYFANARFLEDLVYRLMAERPNLDHLILMCSAVNTLDASGLESLEAINDRLRDAGITLHLSEVKEPVLEGLKSTHFPEDLTGQIFLHQYEAMAALDRPRAEEAAHSGRPQPDMGDGGGI